MPIESDNIISNDLDFIPQSSLSWKTLHNKSIMVTGGSGFIGSYLIKFLLHISKKHSLNLRLICVTRRTESENY